MSTIEKPTREHVRSELQAVLDDEDTLSEGWRRVLVQIHSDLEHLLGVEPCLQLLGDNHNSLAGESHPDAHDRSPGIHLGVHYAHTAVESLWRRYVYRYARRAQAALNAVAAGITPDWNNPLPGERASSGPYDDQRPTPPDVALPEGLAERADLDLIRLCLGNLAAAEQAGDDERELGEYDDPDTGQIRHSIPEHLIATSQDLLAEAERWDEHLGDYADAVVYTLATTLRHLVTEPAPAAT